MGDGWFNGGLPGDREFTRRPPTARASPSDTFLDANFCAPVHR